ncbi:hypothetical protein N7519_011450 [Penicillium mononematosum]|uniref:uncharacterized protein n=1 Tax=Penicillium mononematosum TaxID=268346 RepID=UPI002546E26E|nr:uncharacterized protein N7519_011450 [Penicillium mononematosum]KAJ6180989.1 hypothetical protein N7519_011450 [Penicillium mononematosum]
MDIVASAQAAATLAGMFLEIVQVTKHVIESLKGARTALVEMFTRAERIRLNLELFRSLTNKLSDPMEKITALSFNESAYRQTANEVLELVRKVADSGRRHDLMMKVNWLFYRSNVVAIVKKLEERERDLGLVLTFIAAQSSAITESEVLRLRTRVEEHTKVNDAFSNIHIHQGEETQTTPDNETTDNKQTISELNTDTRPRAGWPDIVVTPSKTSPTLWLGVLIRKSFTPAYLCQRDGLASASYCGRWKTVLESLDEGKKVFNETWPNAVRLRTLPTGQTKGEFRFPDLAASEIAHELGYDDIYSILAPVVRHTLPAATLTFLQARFHGLLCAELEDCGPLPRGGIRLPPLAALTELERPEMWFPLALFRKTIAIKQVFRITVEGWTAIHDAIITGE